MGSSVIHPKPIKILVTCFDVSGDHNTAELIEYAQLVYPKIFHFTAIAGERVAKLKGDNVTLLKSHIVESSIGLLEGLPYLFPTLRFFSWFKSYLQKQCFDLLLCIDGQGRNIRLGQIAKKSGLKTAYFFPPQVSIYGMWNVKRLEKIFDLILCPFEIDHLLYQGGGAHSVFTGHPFGQLQFPSFQQKKKYLNDILNNQKKNISISNYLSSPSEKIKLISIFPGSRFQEIKKLLPIFLKTARKIKYEFPETEFVISCSHLKFKPLIEKSIKEHWHQSKKDNFTSNKKFLPPKILHDCWDEIIQTSYFMIACSGTVTLKASYWGIPHVICYKLSFISSTFVRIITKVNSSKIKLKYIGMANLLAQKEICKELINRNLSVATLYKHVSSFLKDNQKREKLHRQLIDTSQKWKTNQPSSEIICSSILNLFRGNKKFLT